MTSGDDVYTDFQPGNMGNEHAFILASPTQIYDQIQMFRLCAKDENDTTDDIDAFLLVSAKVAHASLQRCTVHLKDEWKLFETTQDGSFYFYPNGSSIVFRMKNHRKIYSIAVGKISWQTTDPAQVYDESCEASNSCNGLYFPLTNINQHVVVGESHIPDIPNFYTIVSFGLSVVLVSSRKQLANPFWSEGINYDIDLIYPPIFPATSDSSAWNLTGVNCTAIGSSLINEAIQRHVYSKVHDTKDTSHTVCRTSIMYTIVSVWLRSAIAMIA